jgi:hypothetical protein
MTAGAGGLAGAAAATTWLSDHSNPTGADAISDLSGPSRRPDLRPPVPGGG